ncbi:hypothetical protein B1218_38805, partial [Pseudomonas ogarae]
RILANVAGSRQPARKGHLLFAPVDTWLNSTFHGANAPVTATATLTDADGQPVRAGDGPVAVTLDSGRTIPRAAGASCGVLEVAVGDDVYQGPTTVTESIASASGGNLEA